MRQADRQVGQHGGFSSIQSHFGLSGSFSAIVKVKERPSASFFIHGVHIAVMAMSGSSIGVALRLPCLFSLWSSSLLPYSGGTSLSVVSEEVVITDKQLSDEFAVEAAWLQGKLP